MNPPSAFFLAERKRLARAATRGPVLDLACGRGRHALAVAELGALCVGCDRDLSKLAELRAEAAARGLGVESFRADLETGRGIPIRPGSCGAILVFRFLFRPLAPAIVEALAPGGLLLYETFTIHQRELGYGPRNPAFLLLPGELPGLFAGLSTLSYWEGQSGGERPEALARLAARKL